jgi:hypothetical protein
MTYRQYLGWCYWLDKQWNLPTREDYYRMQHSCEVRRVLAKNPRAINVNDFKLKFDLGERFEKKVTVEEATMHSMNRWFGAVGFIPSEEDKVKLGLDKIFASGTLVVSNQTPEEPEDDPL